MNTTFIKHLVSSCLLLLLFSCKKQIIVTSAPPEAYSQRKYKPGVSDIFVPVTVPTENIAGKINKEVSGLLYEDNSFEDNDNDNLQLKVWKQADFKLNILKDQLSYQVPLKIWSKYRTEILGMTAEGEGNFALNLKFKTRVSIDSTWKVITHTEPDGYEWITSPNIKVAGMEIPIKWVADIIIKKQKNSMCGMIDQQIGGLVDIRGYAQNIWNSLQDPVSVWDDPKTWLLINPKKFAMTPFYGEAGFLKTSLGLVAITETAIGAKPNVLVNKSLPNLKLSNDIAKDNFFITLGTDIPYSEATQMAKKMQVGQVYEFKNGKYKIKIEDMEVYGSGELLTVKTLVSGKINGYIYLTGKPTYNEEKQSISMENVQFDVNTKNALLKTANWMFHGVFERKIQESMVFPIKDQLDFSRDRLRQALKNNKIPPYILLNGNLHSLDAKDILLTPSGIKTYVELKGNLNVKVDKF